MATMIKWIKKKCRRQSLPGKAPPSVDDLNNFKQLYTIKGGVSNQESYHIYDEIPTMSTANSPGQVAYAVVSLIQKLDTDDKSGHLDKMPLNENGLPKHKVSPRTRNANRPLPPRPSSSGRSAPCPLCRAVIKRGDVCPCVNYREHPTNTTCQCTTGGHTYNDCPESLIDQHFTNSRAFCSTTPSRNPRSVTSSDLNSAIYVPESRCSEASSGYYSDEGFSRQLDGLGMKKPVLRSSRSHNGFLAVPKMGSKIIKRSNSTNDASPTKGTKSPDYLSPIRLSTRPVPSCGVSRSTEKVKLITTGCKRKHSIGEAEGRQARIRTGLQSYRSLSCNRETSSIQRRLNFYRSNIEEDKSKTKVNIYDGKDDLLKRRLQEYRQKKITNASPLKTQTEHRNTQLYKDLVKTRRLSQEYNCENNQIFMAFL
ncbi:hypothetical protein SNE40_016026 [Patella caerulea]|uniref:Uncharacterized protein n=1 Tax=Patella caerulea TaxID=87958 RepID=A0AAN8JCC4_PATCE